MAEKRRALLGIGSNLGDRLSLLATAVETLRETGEVTAVSDVYETEPIGGPDDQGAYLNAVVALDTDLSPADLLELAFSLERAAERVRIVRWGPRTLDVDVLWIDGYSSDDPTLTVPHPRMFERRFVMVPVGDVAPDLVADDWEHALVLDGAVEHVASL